ncbi:MAG: dipeptidase [Janthinobacterium lividum]
MKTTRRAVLAGAAGLAASGVFARAVPKDDRYARAIVIDGLGSPDDPDGDKYPDSNAFSPRGIAQLRASGTTAWQVTVGEVGNAPTTWDATMGNIAQWNAIVDANPAILVRARTAADIRAAKAAGKAAIILGTQDTAMAGTQLDRLDVMNGLGIRVVQLTYNLRNLSGDGALEPADAGLSKLGRATIARIEKNKQLLDFAHGGARTIAEGIAAATRPPTISHTGCRSLHDNPRNVWDSELKACAAKGGVVGIYWMPFLVPGGKPTTADLIRHMAHAVDVCGEDHVGIGTDGSLSEFVLDDKTRAAWKKSFEDRTARGIAAPGEGPDVFNIVGELNSHMRFRMLSDALEKAGWPGARIDKVLGGNLLRLYGEVWGA